VTRIVAVVLGTLTAACGTNGAGPTGPATDGGAPREAGQGAPPGLDATTPAEGAAPGLGATTFADDTGTGDTSGDGSLPLGMCPPPDAGVAPYVGTGTITGSGVSGVICHADARLYLSTATTPPNQLLLMLNSSTSPDDSTFQSPPGASYASFGGFFSVSAPAPGTYGSAIGQPCGSLVFSYNLPIPPSVDCEGGTPGSCRPGCTAACAGFGGLGGCDPCTPVAPEVGYQTYESNDCLGDPQTTQGSWTTTLTSVTLYNNPSGATNGTYYVVHGTFTANMTEGDAGAETAVLTLSF
jgi:hypothetical protein